MKVFFKDKEEFEEYHGETVEELMQLEKKELAEKVFELDQHTALRHTRPLIKRFDEEFDKEDLEANPDRTYAGTLPDAEEVYRRYYNQKETITDLFLERIEVEEIKRIINNRLTEIQDLYEENYIGDVEFKHRTSELFLLRKEIKDLEIENDARRERISTEN